MPSLPGLETAQDVPPLNDLQRRKVSFHWEVHPLLKALREKANKR
jgi:hypothetical protein